MKSRYKLVVFDWEGTLAEDSYGQVVSIIAKEAAHFNNLHLDKHLAKKYLPLGLATFVAKSFPELTIQQQEQLFSRLQSALQNISSEVILTPSAADTVKKLFDNGILLGLATNRSKSSLQKVLSQSGLESYFKVVMTASQAAAKPCPDMLEQIMLECGVANTNTLMIGDSLSDIEMAVAVGVDAVAVDFYHEQQGAFLQAGACLEIDDYQDLLDFLQKSS